MPSFEEWLRQSIHELDESLKGTLNISAGLNEVFYPNHIDEWENEGGSHYPSTA